MFPLISPHLKEARNLSTYDYFRITSIFCQVISQKFFWKINEGEGQALTLRASSIFDILNAIWYHNFCLREEQA